jgi:hypothetical protein
MGRNPNSGLKSSITGKDSASEIHARLVHGSPQWRLVRLLELVEGEKQKLRNDFPRGFLAMVRNAVEQHQLAKPKAPLEELRKWAKGGPKYPREGSSERALRKWKNELAKWAKQAARREKSVQELRDWKNELQKWAESGPDQTVMEIYTLTRDLHAELDDALENADAKWFEEKAKAIRAKERKAERLHERKDRFDAAVVRVLEESRYKDNVTLRQAKRNLFTTARPPAGKQVNFTRAQQVLDKLGAETATRPETIDGRKGKFLMQSKRTYVTVAGCRFADMRRAREAVEAVRKRFGYEWKTAFHG